MCTVFTTTLINYWIIIITFFFRIEHLEGDVLDAMPKALFGLLKPKVVLVTTPNVEFNVLFPGLQGFRHYDHKFEWTRAEFQQWLVKSTLCQHYNLI